MHYISNILYWISTGLLVPVIVLLIFFFGRALVLIGSFFGQYLSIRKTEAFLQKDFEHLTAATLDDLSRQLSQQNHFLVITYLRRLLKCRQNPALIDKLLSDFEVDADKDLGVSKTLAKMGPMLGLMGTLIPMGPALVGLSTGDISSMAYNMQVAFATTVVGLFSSAIGFITQQVKQRWYLRDLNNLEYVANLIKERQ